MMAAVTGCGPVEDKPAPTPAPPSPAAALNTSPVVLFLGTSLTAGQGLDPEEAYPALIQKKIDAAGLAYRVVNAGVGGDTSADALRRLDWLLRQRVDVLVVETGANDALRAQDPAATRDNIRAILDRARSHSPAPRVVLVGMEAPQNLPGARVLATKPTWPPVLVISRCTMPEGGSGHRDTEDAGTSGSSSAERIRTRRSRLDT